MDQEQLINCAFDIKIRLCF